MCNPENITSIPSVSIVSQTWTPDHSDLVVGVCGATGIRLTQPMTRYYARENMVHACEMKCNGKHGSCSDRKIVPADWTTSDKKEPSSNAH